MHPIADQTALVTGSSSGIGLAIVHRLLDEQCKVIGIARNHAKADIDHPLFNSYDQDLSQLEKTSALITGICKDNPIDTLIHCVGEGLFGSIEQFSLAQIERNIHTNLTSALLLAHHVVPLMRKQQSGRIIFIGSESAIQAGKKGALYSSAKFGIRGLAQALREDCSKDGIAVTLINPGMVRSPFFDQLSFRPGDDKSNALLPEDVADTVLHALSTDQHMVIDEINLSPRNKSIQFGKPKSV